MSDFSYIEITNEYTIRGLKTNVSDPKCAVVMLHGFTGHKNETGYLFKNLSELLIESNVVTYRFDYYGNGDSDGAFHQMTFETAKSDSLSVIDYVRQEHPGIPLKVLGYSMGGLVGLEVALLTEIDQLVLLSPAMNLKDIVARRTTTSPLTENGYDLGGYCFSQKFLESIPDDLNRYINITVPTDIFQGETDQAVPKENAIRLHEIIKKSTLKIISNAPHGYTPLEVRKDLFEHLLTKF